MPKNSLLPTKIAAVFTGFDYPNIPFTRLNQLEEIGVIDVYIMLSDDEYQKGLNVPLQLFNFSPPHTILEYYQGHRENSTLKFHIMNTGNKTSEEEKLNYYLKHVKDNYLLNLFICHTELPWVSPDLRSTPFLESVSTYALPFIKTTSRVMPKVQQIRSSEKALELLQRETNPVYCHQIGHFDIVYYQWLFNIFIELTNIKLIKNNDPDGKEKLTALINSYDENITALKNAETSFDAMHKICYPYDVDSVPSEYNKRKLKQCYEKKERYKNNFVKIIKEMIAFYSGTDLLPRPANWQKKTALAVGGIMLLGIFAYNKLLQDDTSLMCSEFNNRPF